MKYTVKQLADLSGVTVRTLHHYDEIGLLKPAEIGKNGYRYYDEPLSIGAYDEVGKLAEVINTMSSRLVNSQKELEDSVAKRTREFEASKSELRDKISELERVNRLMVDREIKMIEMKKLFGDNSKNKKSDF